MADPNWADRTIFTGDNLPIMRGMNSESVDLIYLDPPFNSKTDYAAPIGSKAAGAAFKDTWSLSDIDAEWINLLESREPTLWRVIMAAMSPSDKSYLAYMAVRLLQMRRLLKPTGSIYLHCDPYASHYLKLVMDAVFGKGNFRNEIAWKRTDGAKQSQHAPKTWGRSGDRILFYAASEDTVVSPYRQLTRAEHDRKFNKAGPDGRRYFTSGLSIFRRPAHGPRPNLCYSWRGFTNKHSSGWALSRERLEEEFQKGNIVIRDDGKLERRKYEDDYPGLPTADIWPDIKNLAGGNSERTGYPTQKPLALLDRVIRASSNEGDLVLDPFCGCATAPVAAEMAGRNWAGIDISAKAGQLVQERLKCPPPLGIGALFHNRLVTHRIDVPQRTDLGPLPAYNSAQNRQALYGQQEGHCAGCNEHFQAQHLTVDHIIAKSKGGTDHLDNLQLLCGHCNSVKGDRGMEYLRTKLQLAS